MSNPQKNTPLNSLRDAGNQVKKAFKQEVEETKHLAQLLKRRFRDKKPLTRTEAQQVGDQLQDIGKLIPLITLLLLPGGAFVAIVLERILPFSLLPSAFRDLLPKD